MGSWLISTRSWQILDLLLWQILRTVVVYACCRLWVSSPARQWSECRPWSPDYVLLFLFEVKFFVFDVRLVFLRVAAGGEGVRGVARVCMALRGWRVCMALRSSSMSFLSRRRTRVLPDLESFLLLFLISGGDFLFNCCTCFFTFNFTAWLGFDILSDSLLLLMSISIFSLNISWFVITPTSSIAYTLSIL